ncbi:uncharacterized protein LOC106476666 [Limulus polyphemus]|uniref:Uncharacterized protein LOC106476666 n=1 Tax=Limulus polyphemus TaxID=6850 RepID=A0ABM1C1X7_LIMPO|nr:uncharacterized protein LOC106476666 [Limulus polyphemus]
MREYSEVAAISEQRPNLIFFSDSSRAIVAIELTGPYESRISEKHEIKLARHQELTKEIQSQDYGTRLFAVKEGVRRLPSVSVYNLLKQLGLSSQRRSKILRELAATVRPQIGYRQREVMKAGE